MLTLRQTLILSGQTSSGAVNIAAIRTQFPSSPLSLASLARGLANQRTVIFVSLASARIFKTHYINNLYDLAVASLTADAIVQPSEIAELTQAFADLGISVREIDRAKQRYALVGLAADLVNAPTTVVNGANLIHVRDKYSGAEAIGGAILGVGAILIGIGVVATAPAWVLPVGAGVAGFGFGAVISAGVMDIMQDSGPPKRSDSQETSPVTNDLGTEGDGETIDVPNAVAIGDAPPGLNTDTLLQELGDTAVAFSVDMVLSDLPGGLGSTTGGLPGGLPSDGSGGGDGGDGGGLNPFG